MSKKLRRDRDMYPAKVAGGWVLALVVVGIIIWLVVSHLHGPVCPPGENLLPQPLPDNQFMYVCQ